MGKPATGNVYESRGKWYARIRVADTRPSIALTTCDDESSAENRCALLVEVTGRLRASGAGEALTLEVLRKLAIRGTGKPLEDALRGVEAICLGNTRSTTRTAAQLQTVRDVGEAWTSGDLARAYPDHVKVKRSSSDDVTRLTLHVYDEIGNVPIAALTLDHAMIVLERLSSDLSNATRRQVAQALNRIVNLSVFPLRLRDASPLPRGWLPKVSNQRKSNCLFPDEETRHMAHKAVPLPFRVFYGVVAREGFRASEAASLRWRDLDLDRGFIALDKNKTDDPRSWPMAPGTTRGLLAWRALEGNPDGDAFVFHDDEGKPLVRWVKIDEDDAGKPVLNPECSLRAQLYREHLKLAGVDRARLFADDEVSEPTGLHELRGLFITTALANGRSESWVSEKTGHKSSQMIERYRRRARNLIEADLRQRDLLPLDEAIPELRATGGKRAAPKTKRHLSMRTKRKVARKRTERHAQRVTEGIQNPLPEMVCRFDPDLRYYFCGGFF